MGRITTLVLCRPSPLNLHHFRWPWVPNSYSSKISGKCNRTDPNTIRRYFASIRLLFITSISFSWVSKFGFKTDIETSKIDKLNFWFNLIGPLYLALLLSLNNIFKDNKSKIIFIPNLVFLMSRKQVMCTNWLKLWFIYKISVFKFGMVSCGKNSTEIRFKMQLFRLRPGCEQPHEPIIVGLSRPNHHLFCWFFLFLRWELSRILFFVVVAEWIMDFCVFFLICAAFEIERLSFLFLGFFPRL